MCGEFNLIYSQRFRSRGQRLCIFIGTKESVFIRKEFNSHRIGLGHQHGRRLLFWKTNMAETLYSLQDVGNGKVHSTTLVEREKKKFIQFKSERLTTKILK